MDDTWEKNKETTEEDLEIEQKYDKKVASYAVEQLRPHFVFNILNQMKYQAKKDPQLVEEMVYDFANFFRGRLTVAALEQETVLDEEIRAFKSYLKLECTMNKNMQLQMDLSYEKGVRHMLVMPGILQDFAAMLVKEEIRTTKDKRTLVVTDGLCEDHYYIHVEIKELGQTFVHPIPCIKGE